MKKLSKSAKQKQQKGRMVISSALGLAAACAAILAAAQLILHGFIKEEMIPVLGKGICISAAAVASCLAGRKWGTFQDVISAAILLVVLWSVLGFGLFDGNLQQIGNVILYSAVGVSITAMLMSFVRMKVPRRRIRR